MPVTRSILPSLATIALLVAFAPAARGGELPIRVVTSIPPLAMIVAELGGNRVSVRSILPPGADPHTFEPLPSDAVAVAESDIVVALGSSIDDWLGNAITAPAGECFARLRG